MGLTQLFRAKDWPDVERLWNENERLARMCVGSDTALDENRAIDLLCSAARNVVDADGACVVLREGELVHYAREDSIAPLWAGLKFSIKACISGWSIIHKSPVVISDIYSDARIPIEYYKSTYVKSLAMMPIQPANPVGAIGVYWARTHKATPRELRLLEKLASVAAITLSHAQLHQRIERIRAQADESFATVSHELRSYLNVILGWADILRRQQLDATGVSRAVDVIERNARAQGRLVDDLLDASRIASGKLRLDCRRVDIGVVVRQTIDAVRPLAAAKDIKLDVSIDASPLECQGDEVRLQQIVTNLLTNACKFSPEGATVTIKASRNANQAEVTITDQGKGISAEVLPHIFEAFHQGHEHDSEGHGGLGLGLAIARTLVGLHGGVIEASSPGVGGGATFTCRIPIL